jgi:CRISPR/Cas system CMR-associated protein Cmr5 small subunit
MTEVRAQTALRVGGAQAGVQPVGPVVRIFSVIVIVLGPIAAWAANGVSLPLAALYVEPSQAISYGLFGQQGLTLSLDERSEKENIKNVKKLTILKSALPKSKRMLRGYVQAKCIGEIVDDLYRIVKWSKVKDIALRKSIWWLYSRKRKIEFKLFGFMLIKIGYKKESLVAYYTYNRVDIKKEYDEEGILADLGLSKYM